MRVLCRTFTTKVLLVKEVYYSTVYNGLVFVTLDDNFLLLKGDSFLSQLVFRLYSTGILDVTNFGCLISIDSDDCN